MYNDSKSISASEINRYTYCPYQWYYERKFGSKEIRRLRKEKFAEMGLTDSTQSNFSRGLDFHNTYLREYRLKKIFRFVLFLVFIIFIIGCILYFINIK